MTRLPRPKALNNQRNVKLLLSAYGNKQLSPPTNNHKISRANLNATIKNTPMYVNLGQAKNFF
jgi:hypothetical protein